RHAEDIFGELFNEANSFYLRMSSLQERVDQLAVKVTQLDSTVEEVSLQDINMRKAFKSSTIQDQQVVSRTSVPNPVVEMYHRCDKPPPLNILTPYRDDKKDALKFYTDPSYFFNLWKEKMLQATEDKRKEKRRQKVKRERERGERRGREREIEGVRKRGRKDKRQKRGGKSVRVVRKARNRRQEWNVLAYDKEFRPDARLTPSPYHGMSSEGSLSPDNSRHKHFFFNKITPPSSCLFSPSHSSSQAAHPQDHSRDHLGAPQTQSLDRVLRPTQPTPGSAAASGRHAASLGRTPSAHGTQPDHMVNGPRQQSVKEYRAHGGQPSTIPEYYIPPAPPPPPPSMPSAQAPYDSSVAPPTAASIPPTSSAMSRPYSPSPSPPPVNYVPSPAHPPSGAPPAAPPPPPPGGPAVHPSPPLAQPDSAPQRKSTMLGMIPMSDARSDLLAAIRRGIQLRKVQEQREQEAKREPVGNDVATILSRRIAVEYSESDEDSEMDDNEWSD
ncbi:hypothetical protein NL108_009644, partial [Boleophthalmus pectinirostris]